MGKSLETRCRTLEDISSAHGRPTVIDVDAVRGLMREQGRYEEFLAVIGRPPRTNFLCPACHPKMSMVCMDACFKLWRYANAFKLEEGHVLGSPGAEGSLYADQAVVKAMLEAFAEARAGEPTEASQTCGTSDIAALRHAAQAGRRLMDVTATYFATCPHSIFLKAFDFHGGELHDYSVAMYLLLGDDTSSVICGDTMCQVYKRFLLMQRLQDSNKLVLPGGPGGVFWKSIKECVFAVNAMHIRGVRAHADLHRSPSSCVSVASSATASAARVCVARTRAATPTLTETARHVPSRPILRSSLHRPVHSTAFSAASSTAAGTSRLPDVTTARRASAYARGYRKTALRACAPSAVRFLSSHPACARAPRALYRFALS